MQRVEPTEFELMEVDDEELLTPSATKSNDSFPDISLDYSEKDQALMLMNFEELENYFLSSEIHSNSAVENQGNNNPITLEDEFIETFFNIANDKTGENISPVENEFLPENSASFFQSHDVTPVVPEELSFLPPVVEVGLQPKVKFSLSEDKQFYNLADPEKYSEMKKEDHKINFNKTVRTMVLGNKKNNNNSTQELYDRNKSYRCTIFNNYFFVSYKLNSDKYSFHFTVEYYIKYSDHLYYKSGKPFIYPPYSLKDYSLQQKTTSVNIPQRRLNVNQNKNILFFTPSSLANELLINDELPQVLIVGRCMQAKFILSADRTLYIYAGFLGKEEERQKRRNLNLIVESIVFENPDNNHFDHDIKVMAHNKTFFKQCWLANDELTFYFTVNDYKKYSQHLRYQTDKLFITPSYSPEGVLPKHLLNPNISSI